MTDEKNDATQGQTANNAPTPAKLEPLQLPHGAFIAYRVTGGTNPNAREIVVYPDGRVSVGGPDEAKQIYARAGRKLNDGQMARLRKMLDQAGFFRLATATSGQSSDAMAHEIVARIGSRANHVQVFEGSIPDALAPLIQQLNALMPKE